MAFQLVAQGPCADMAHFKKVHCGVVTCMLLQTLVWV